MRPFVWLLAAGVLIGCAPPALTQDGQMVFTEREQRGATVLTANGVEFVDKNHVPAPVIRKSAFEPWRPPTGFLLPADGVLRKMSKAHTIDSRGMAVAVRSSDVLVPSWGGEVLVRLDAIVPAHAHPQGASTVRKPIRLVVVLDDAGDGSLPLVETALDALGARDRAAIVNSGNGGRTAVPLVPGTHRSLLEGAAERTLASRTRQPRDLSRALALAAHWLGTGKDGLERRLLVLTDGFGAAADSGKVTRQVRILEAKGVRVTAVAATDRVERDVLEPFGDDIVAGLDDARAAAVEESFAPPGETVMSDVVLSFSSAPAPARLIESSSGEIVMTLEEDRLDLGDLYVGEARTEVVRIAVPAWTPGERWDLSVTLTHSDATGRRWRARRKIPMLYSDRIEQIAEQRAGDVIAYASALAMVRRLERAFLGSAIDQLGGLRGVVRWQAESMAVLAKERRDRSLASQAEVLETLLGAVDE